MCAFLESTFELFWAISVDVRRPTGQIESYQWNDFRRLRYQSMCEFLVEVDQIIYVDIAVVLLEQCIFFQLVTVGSISTAPGPNPDSRGENVPVYKVVIKSEVKDEGLELRLELGS